MGKTFAYQVDRNQPRIVEALRRSGWTVRHTHNVHRGFPDLVVAKRGLTVLVEVKHGTSSLNDNQKRFAAQWPGCFVVARTPSGAIEKCEALLEASPQERHAAVAHRRDTFQQYLVRKSGNAGIFEHAAK